MAPVWQPQDAHLALRPAEGDLQLVHGLDHGPHGHEDVLVNEPPEALAVLLRVASPVDDAHLLDERALPALAGACGGTPSLGLNLDLPSSNPGAEAAPRDPGERLHHPSQKESPFPKTPDRDGPCLLRPREDGPSPPLGAPGRGRQTAALGRIQPRPVFARPGGFHGLRVFSVSDTSRVPVFTF